MPYKKKPCSVCGASHTNKYYCSKSCAGKINGCKNSANKTPKTKICEKCKKQFTSENGKIRLRKRKYCLDCSPFKKQKVNSDDYLICSKCKKERTRNEFYWFKTKPDIKKDKRCKKCCWQQEYIRKRKIKQELIDYAGGKCKICGYNKSTYALEFHHLNTNEKDFSISGKILSPTIKAEIDKCILVCSNCHREIHEKKLIENHS